MSRNFGRYVIRDEVKDLLGRGGFGRVYRAFDPNLSRDVAIKILSSGNDEEMVKRFQDESRTTCKLTHENIVKVHDFGLQDGLPYLVMELLEGETLEKVIKNDSISGRPVELLDKVEVMVQVAKGLQYAHGENVIHRDIKPGNIMVLPNGVAKIMDFGIARVVDKDGTRRTRQGNIAGTILYMGPEQFNGEDADKLTDIFCYGGLYYELLTREHPFAADDMGSVMFRITTVEPPPIRQKVSECPEALDSAILYMLTKEREFRVKKMEDVVRITQPILIGLRRQKAAAIVADIPRLIEQGLTEQAHVAVGQALDLDPINQEANRLLVDLSEQSQMKAKRLRAEARVREANEHAAAGRLDDALHSMSAALTLDPSNTDLRGRFSKLESQARQSKEAVRLAAEARAEREAGNLEGALELVGRANELDPNNKEAARLREDFAEELRSRRQSAEIARAEDLRLRGQFAEAMAVLDRMSVGVNTGSKVAALRAIIARDKAEAERQKRNERFQIALSAARMALLSRSLDDAIAAANELCREYPDEPAAAEFQSEVLENQAAQKRLTEIGILQQNARVLIRANQLPEAESLLQGGLQSYPGDTTISRLMEMVVSLGAARERVRRVNEIIRQAHDLMDAHQLDQAEEVVNSGLKEFGNETDLVEAKKRLDFEKEHSEQLSALQKTMEQARGLLAENRPKEAVDMLEESSFRFPGEPGVSALLSSARMALAAAMERDFVARELQRAAPMEAGKQFANAIGVVDGALARYPTNGELQTASTRLRRGLLEQEREAAVAARVRKIEQAMTAGQWDQAETGAEAGQKEFAGHPAWPALAIRIKEGRRRAGLEQLRVRLEATFANGDLPDARRQLEAAGQSWSQDPVWQALWRQYEGRQAYQTGLAAAEETARAGKFEEAERILQPLLAVAPDGRADALRQQVQQDRLKDEERIRREFQERLQQEAAEEARRKRERALAAGRQEAAELTQKGDFRGARETLTRLIRQWSAESELRRDLEAAESMLAGQVRVEEQKRAEAQLRIQAEREAVGVGRRQAAEMAGRGDYDGAVAFLADLAKQYPDHSDILADRWAAAEELANRKREAEELARRERVRVVAQGRADAARLVANREFRDAIAILDALGQQYQDPQIAADRAEAVRGLEKQRQELEQRSQQQQVDDAVVRGCEEAAALTRRGDGQQALALLETLARQYPAHQAIEAERTRTQLAMERQARDQRDQSQIATERAQATAFRNNGDPNAAILILDRLLSHYPRNLELRQDRDAAAREMDAARRDLTRRATEALGRYRPPSPPPAPAPTAAEDRAKQALQAHAGKNPATPAARKKPANSPFAAIRGILFGLAARAVAIFHLLLSRLAGGSGTAKRRDRFAMASLAWLSEQDRSNLAIQSARESVIVELARRRLDPSRVPPMSVEDRAVMSALGAMGLLLVAILLYVMFSKVEVVANPTSVVFDYKEGARPKTKEVVLSRDLVLGMHHEKDWLETVRSANGVSVAIQDPIPGEGHYEDILHIEFQSKAVKNRFLDIPVKVNVAAPMRVTPQAPPALTRPGSFTLTVTGTNRFSVSVDKAWLKAESQEHTITVLAASPGTSPTIYYGNLTVKDEETGVPVTVPVRFHVIAPVPPPL